MTNKLSDETALKTAILGLLDYIDQAQYKYSANRLRTKYLAKEIRRKFFNEQSSPDAPEAALEQPESRDVKSSDCSPEKAKAELEGKDE